MATAENNIFSNLTETKDLSKYMLMRGVTDWADLSQYNLYESGYSFLVVCKIPKILEKLRAKTDEYKKLIDTYVHILEYDFRGLSGIENITSETGQLTNGIQNIEIINKVQKQSASQFSMTYLERKGGVISRVNELLLRAIKDPVTEVKTYLGLIEEGELEDGFENEVFSFMYIVADNTLMNLEKAYYIVAAQPTEANNDIFNSDKASIEFKELTVTFRGYPITNIKVQEKAKSFLDWIRTNTTWIETDFNYTGVNDLTPYNNSILTSDGNSVAYTK